MSLHDELRAARRCVEDLTRCVTRLERELGRGIETRRLRSDAEHLRESLDLLADAAPGQVPDGGRELIGVPEAPYDDRLWTDADDEGVGARRGPGGPP
ncbi:hypothetical protein [Streptomyces litchfieldiae]|uniref:Uncharacterized protein n=1 Tax=Streptomyces litchfieldiae TaxID=3075543 RepID=A0ABU2MLK2_9ACTN|nr:hypothetical protein [Streptomyces sp. DSM 44938]MDT0342485.1 hypothetical protein [Streptomyces sp. DSM 44938]